MAANTSDSYRNYFLNRMKAYGLYCSEEMSNMDIQPEVLEKSLQTRRPAITSCPSGWWMIVSSL